MIRPTRPRDPSNPVDRTPRAPGSTPTTEAEEHLELPHERDESTGSTSPIPDPGMRQAHRDLRSGQVDTDMRAPPGLDAEQRARYVPGAGGLHPSQEARTPPAPRKTRRR
ncbi:hypothetical protein [Hydrogenophaga sp.]|uniref:hypothetical protein n=1 Tax=Hydrogenophaga sp. TaxID=1904254 RepID=UPI003D0B978D